MRSVAAIAAQALERDALAERASRATVEAETERLRSDLLATVSHDLRTPLAAIRGAASAVLHSPTATLSASEREMLEDTSSEAERLARLVENLLQLGRLDQGRLTLTRVWTPVDELFDAALRQSARAADTSRIRINLPVEPLLCWADEPIIIQALSNLIDNALKYAPTGEISLSAARDAHHIRFEVSDRGPGFPPGDPSTYFERFRRADTPATRSARGSGLGLAICRAAAIAHGGALEAFNAPEGGARVALLLPCPSDQTEPTLHAEHDA